MTQPVTDKMIEAAWRVVQDGPTLPNDYAVFQAGYKAALAHQDGEDAWRPIEEAPSDGTVVDLWMKDGTRVPECRWYELALVYRTPWLNAFVFPDEATHFRLLPNPPKQKDAQNG